jgi:hypothetical protein
LGLALTQSNKTSFKGRPFAAEILLREVCWYLQLAIGYVELARILSARSVQVDHATPFPWIQAYAPELDNRSRPRLQKANGSWCIDETFRRIFGLIRRVQGCVMLIVVSQVAIRWSITTMFKNCVRMAHKRQAENTIITNRRSADR